jgi:hypothetical protein
MLYENGKQKKNYVLLNTVHIKCEKAKLQNCKRGITENQKNNCVILNITHRKCKITELKKRNIALNITFLSHKFSDITF